MLLRFAFAHFLILTINMFSFDLSGTGQLSSSWFENGKISEILGTGSLGLFYFFTQYSTHQSRSTSKLDSEWVSLSVLTKKNHEYIKRPGEVAYILHVQRGSFDDLLRLCTYDAICTHRKIYKAIQQTRQMFY